MRKIVALDANLLVLLAVGAADVNFIARHKRLHPVYRQEHYDGLAALIARAPSLGTTTHALTEASNLARQCHEPMRSQVMAALAVIIRASEELTPAAAAASMTPEFFRLGLTDSVFTLLDPERYLVLSADYALVDALARRGFDAVCFPGAFD